ncbi:GNAT family N-acetyltransferase [Kitasatospora sp. NPDC052896]|uniref:GNAT family N-acetyltransferase n=1 Tax=Kitasatospora sp. NPDC052896 TaxID=3364061 RepID=UPI0037CC25AE
MDEWEAGPMMALIEPATAADAPLLAQVLLAAWLETYPNEAAGIDEAWIREQRGDVVSADGVARWREVVERSVRAPGELPPPVFCRVVRVEGQIVGLLCGLRDERDAGAVTLGPMYLLARAQGRGIGRRLLEQFLDWAGEARIRLWVTAYNDQAVRFYTRHGFRPTGEEMLWQGRLPNLRMERPPGVVPLDGERP